MKFFPKKRLLAAALTQVSIFLLSLIFYHGISLLSYINISFYISAALLLASLLVYTVQTGFYDAIAKSFNFFASNKITDRKFTEIPALSELVTIDKKPLLFHGIVSVTIMLIALLIYYALLT